MQAPYLNYARTLFGANSPMASGAASAGVVTQRQRPQNYQGDQQQAQRPSSASAPPQRATTFAQLQQQGVARPAPPPAPAPGAAPAPTASSTPQPPTWLASAMTPPSSPPMGTPQPMPGSPSAPTPIAPAPIAPMTPTSAPQTGDPANQGQPPKYATTNVPGDTKYPTPDATHPGGFGGYDPNKPPPGQDPNAWAYGTGGVDLRTGQPANFQVLDIGGKSTSFPSDFAQWTPQQWQSLFADAKTNPLVQGTVTGQRYAEAERAFQQGGPQAAALVMNRNLSAADATSGNYPGGPHYTPPAVPTGGAQPTTTSLNQANPNDDLAQSYASLFGRQAQDIDDQYALDQQHLEEDMARRGLADSSIRGGRLADLNVSKRSAKTDLATRLAAELGTTAWQRSLQNKQFDLSKELGEGNLGLAQQQARNDMEKFAQQMGLSRDQFNEAIRQFNTNSDWQHTYDSNQLLLMLLPYLRDSGMTDAQIQQYFGTPTGGTH